jgi:flagellar basal-body rod protein FlgB
MISGVASNLEHYMDLLAARQKLVASNIANADTPGYKTKDVDFHSEFMGALHGSSPNVLEVDGLAVHNDGNNVNIDREARLLAENTMRFNVASNMMRNQLRYIRMAITEGKNG